MLAFTIPDTRHFMALLLKGDAFDDFAFRQGEISAFLIFPLTETGSGLLRRNRHRAMVQLERDQASCVSGSKRKENTQEHEACSFPFSEKNSGFSQHKGAVLESFIPGRYLIMYSFCRTGKFFSG